VVTKTIDEKENRRINITIKLKKTTVSYTLLLVTCWFISGLTYSENKYTQGPVGLREGQEEARCYRLEKWVLRY